MSLATGEPQRVRTLVLVDGGYAGSGSGEPPNAVAYLPFAGALVAWIFLNEDSIRRALEASVYDPAVVDRSMVRGYLRRLKVEGFDDVLSGFATARNESAAIDPRQINARTPVIGGVHDRVFPLVAGEQLAKEIPGAEIVRFEASAHLPMEEEPQRFVEILRGFVQPNGK